MSQAIAPSPSTASSNATTRIDVTTELNFEERMREAQIGRKLAWVASSVCYPAIGMVSLLGIWWFGGKWIANNPDLVAFSDFAPVPTLAALKHMWDSGSLWEPIYASMGRIARGMFWAAVIGIPVGIAVGRFKMISNTTNMPMQFLRMISPLAWMPIAVMVFDTWEGSIVFLLTVAAVWPIVFSTSNGLSKIDPDWFAVARNLGAKPWQLLWHVILPAAAQDIFMGLRIALGVVWIVIVPAEFLGVTSGLGYAINDARDCLEYDRLAATVLVIGVLGFLLDSVLRIAVQRTNWVEARYVE